MEITTGNPFWLRLGQHSGWSRDLVLAWVGGAAGLAILVGGLAAAAQHEAQVNARAQGLGGTYTYSLTGHVTAMVLAGALAVTVAVTLVQSGRRVLAGLVLVAVALGPMTLVATPLRAALVPVSYMDTRLWWHAVVGAAVVAVLAGWTWAVAHHLPAPPARSPGTDAARTRFPSETILVFALIVVGFLVTWGRSFALQESVGVVPAAGWAVLAAGMVMATAFRGWRVSVASIALAVALLVTMYGAYHRDGGWPGVAGWEFGGMQSPVVLSAGVAALLLLAAPVGAGAGWFKDLSSRRIIADHTAIEGSPATSAAI
jgi:hypothetical protein